MLSTLSAAGIDDSSGFSMWVLLALLGAAAAAAGAVWVGVSARRRMLHKPPVSASGLASLRRAVAGLDDPPRVRRGSVGAGLETVVSAADSDVCPTCAAGYTAGERFCKHDGRVLVSMVDLAAAASLGSEVCSTCERAYEHGFGACPFDGGELVPVALYEATRGALGSLPPTGTLGHYCPDCHGRYDVASKFCSRDGAVLVALN